MFLRRVKSLKFIGKTSVFDGRLHVRMVKVSKKHQKWDQHPSEIQWTIDQEIMFFHSRFLDLLFFFFFWIFVQKQSILGPPSKSDGVKNGTKIRQVVPQISNFLLYVACVWRYSKRLASRIVFRALLASILVDLGWIWGLGTSFFHQKSI